VEVGRLVLDDREEKFGEVQAHERFIGTESRGLKWGENPMRLTRTRKLARAP
jgi:hypothetical protein